MASSILHIKDSYYFEVPRALKRSHRTAREDFPAFWVRLDDEYQTWEANRILDLLQKSDSFKAAELQNRVGLVKSYQEWRAEHKNFARPFSTYLEQQAWFKTLLGNEKANNAWQEIKVKASDAALYEKSAPAWSDEKIQEYNHQLDGKILIPQPFGEIKNLYERQSGFAISKFMILELLAALLICVFFFWLARQMRTSVRPRGRLWNMFEAILIYFRDNVARPAIGGHDADKFVPLLWTMFIFILTCNLLGLLPWLGAPTGSFAVTLALAVVTFATGLFFGMRKFGVLGYWKNQVPHLGLPWYMAIVIVPMIFLIEVVGLIIKHAVLGVRLLANMMAGHLVLLAVMGLAVAAAGSSLWGVTATIAVVGSALFSCLELFVAFLQAYVFTFLSALFIGMAIHHH
jgi:F-type H+-transporting ATPase subunit a